VISQYFKPLIQFLIGNITFSRRFFRSVPNCGVHQHRYCSTLSSFPSKMNAPLIAQRRSVQGPPPFLMTFWQLIFFQPTAAIPSMIVLLLNRQRPLTLQLSQTNRRPIRRKQSSRINSIKYISRIAILAINANAALLQNNAVHFGLT
jgi:hypothetical protein